MTCRTSVEPADAGISGMALVGAATLDVTTEATKTAELLWEVGTAVEDVLVVVVVVGGHEARIQEEPGAITTPLRGSRTAGRTSILDLLALGTCLPASTCANEQHNRARQTEAGKLENMVANYAIKTQKRVYV